MTDGVDQHPVAGHLTQILQDFTAPALPPDFGTFAAFLQQRYAELIALLRKSIELNEPLLCSL